MQAEKQDSTRVTFKSGQLSKKLGVTTQTIRRWVHRFSDFFTERAKVEDKYKVGYSPDDVLIITTILYFSAKGIGLDDIEERLKSGIREGEELVQELIANQEMNISTFDKTVDPKIVQFELRQTRQERDQALITVRQLEEKYTAKDQEVSVLLREMATLQYRLGVAEGELNSLRRQLEKQT